MSTLLTRLEPLLGEVGSVIDEINTFCDRPSGRLRINTSRIAAHMVVVPLMARFLSAFPEISLEIVDDNGIVDIVASGFDAGLRFLETVPEDMIAVPIGKECRFAVVVTQDCFERTGRLPTRMICVRTNASATAFPPVEFSVGNSRRLANDSTSMSKDA